MIFLDTNCLYMPYAPCPCSCLQVIAKFNLLTKQTHQDKLPSPGSKRKKSNGLRAL